MIADVLAHGVGSRNDLPIPAFYAFAAGVAALFISFLGLAILWPVSRFRGAAAGLPLPRTTRVVDSRPMRQGLRCLGAILALFTLGWLLFGPDDPDRNPGPWLIYVVFWVGLVPASLLCGPIWRALNPLRSMHLPLVRLLPARPRTLPPWVGYRPAALALLAFAWLELVSPAPASKVALLGFLGIYAVAQVAGSLVFGPRWFDRCDGFELYSTLVGRLAIIGRGAGGRLVLRSPFDGLDALTVAPGLVATICVLLGSTVYDGISSSPSWTGFLQASPIGRTAAGTLGLFGAIALVAGLYALCAGLFGRLPLTAFAHSLVPIVIGYAIAHYFSLLVADGPRAVLLAFGLPAGPGDALLPSLGTIAVVQVSAIITGHLLGVVAAHDRAVRLLPPERAIAGQIPLFILMLCYTVAGLALLFAS